MSVHDGSTGRIASDRAGASLELLTDNEGLWTAVPADAAGDERLTHWITVVEADLHDLEEWR